MQMVVVSSCCDGVNPAVPSKQALRVTVGTRHGCYPSVWVCMDLAHMCSAILVPRRAEGDDPGLPRTQGSELSESSPYPQAGSRNCGDRTPGAARSTQRRGCCKGHSYP